MKRNNIFLIAFALLILSSCATSKKIKLADDLYQEGSFYNAIDKYAEAYEKKENNTRLTFQMAETNRQMKDYKQAEKWYAKTVELNESAWPEAKFYLAQMLKAQGKYDEAIDAYNDFLDTPESDKKKKGDDGNMMASMKKRAKIDLAGAELAEEMMEVKPEAEVEHVDGGLNNSLQDFSPKYIDNNQVLMAALLPNDAVNLTEAHEGNENYYAKMYYATLENGSWERELLPENINSTSLHVGNGVLSADGNTLYYTQCDEDDAHRMSCNIFKSVKSGSNWSDPEAIEGINKKNSSTTQPALGMDANGDEVMYFASNRSGGKGGYDIWYSVMEDGEFGRPKNMGGEMNTKWDELTPFYDNTNGLLYFSSEGHPGLGGLDVFKVMGNVGSFDANVVNAGYPVNSSADDLYLALNDAGNKGFMVSNREGTTSPRGNTCCDDVFKVNLVQDKYISIIALDSAGNEIEDVNVALYSSIDGEFDFIGDGVTGDSDIIFLTAEETDYKINGSKDGYWPSIANVKMQDFEDMEGDTLIAKVIMRPIKRVKINNVFFAFDKHAVRETYKARMDSIYDLMVKYEELLVKVDGHTDSKGSDAYNQKLSDKRAEEAKAYLMERGVVEDRILTKGYGETKPIAPNENEDGSDNPEGRAKNRRVEFKLLNDVNEDLPIKIEYGDDGPFGID